MRSKAMGATSSWQCARVAFCFCVVENTVSARVQGFYPRSIAGPAPGAVTYCVVWR